MELSKVIYVMGPPGAGKGTQAQLLAEEIGYERFSTGDAFRRISRENTDLGRRVKETIDNGFLAPPEMAAEVVIAAIQQSVEQKKGLIFDGTPRTVKEAKIVDAFFEEHEYGRPLAIFISIEEQTMIERNSQRKFCLDIDGDFPVVTEEDRQRCESMGGRVGTRPDDEEEIFKTRWNEFQNQTYPVIKKYLEEGIARQIEGIGSIEEVHQKVMNLISTLTR